MADKKDKFEEHLEQAKAKFEPNVHGSFDCQICDEYVGEAYHDREHQMLIWKCSQGHASHLGDFILG